MSKVKIGSRSFHLGKFKSKLIASNVDLVGLTIEWANYHNSPYQRCEMFQLETAWWERDLLSDDGCLMFSVKDSSYYFVRNIYPAYFADVLVGFQFASKFFNVNDYRSSKYQESESYSFLDSFSKFLIEFRPELVQNYIPDDSVSNEGLWDYAWMILAEVVEEYRLPNSVTAGIPPEFEDCFN